MNKTPSRVERETVAGLQRRSRRGFLTAAIAAAAGAGIWKYEPYHPYSFTIRPEGLRMTLTLEHSEHSIQNRCQFPV